MPMKKVAATLAGMAIATTCLSARAEDPTTQQQLLDQVKALRSQVEGLETRLKAAEDAGRNDPDLAQAQRAVADDVLADAARHSQLLDIQGFTAGYTSDRGFVLRSADGNFLLHPWGFFQFRNETTYRQGAIPGGGDDLQNGFEVRRIKLGVDGNLYGPDFTYQLILSVDRHNGAITTEDAWVRYRVPGSGLFVRAGQIRDPFDHEQITFAPFLMTSERSITNSLLAGGDAIVQAASVGWDNGGPIRGEVAFTDGLRSLNTNFQDFPNTGIPADWGVAGRVEWKPMGDWKQYSDFSALGDTKQLLVFGAGADYTQAGDTGQFLHVVDAQYECPCGFSVYGAYLGRYVAHNGGAIGTDGGSTSATAGPNTYDSTLRLQAAFLINQRWEPFARYEYIQFDRKDFAAAPGHTSVHEFTLGVNYYFQGQRAKFTADASYLPNGAPVNDDSSGVLSNDGSNEFILRAQFQLLL